MKLKFDINRDLLFESYLNGELNEEENKQFLEVVNNDSRLKEEFEAHKLIHDYYTSERQNRLKEVLNNHRVKTKRKSKKIFFIKAASTLAACLCGIIFLGNLIFGPQPTANELYTIHFETYQNVYNPTVRSLEDNPNLSIDSQLMLAYDNEDYSSMIKIYESNKTYLSYESAFSFYTGLAYMNLENTNEAKILLSKISKDSKFYDKARWYLALCFLSEENLSEFEKITKNLKYKKDISKEILEELK